MRGLKGRLEPTVVRLLSPRPLSQDELIESEFTPSIQMLLGGKTQNFGAGVSVLTLISIKDLAADGQICLGKHYSDVGSIQKDYSLTLVRISLLIHSGLLVCSV